MSNNQSASSGKVVNCENRGFLLLDTHFKYFLFPVMLRDVLGLIVFVALKLTRKVKACSLAENRSANWSYEGILYMVLGRFGWFC